MYCAAVCRPAGEVIVDNPYNDLENAIADLKTMHVSYLNEDYDRNVLDKWAGTVVNTDDCYDGMDGWSYVERHLGYRLWIAGAAFEPFVLGGYGGGKCCFKKQRVCTVLPADKKSV